MAPSLFEEPLGNAPAICNGDVVGFQDSKLDPSIPHVNSATAHFHISVLRKFDEIYYSLEHDPSQDDHTENNNSIQSFLVVAEFRYIQYLNLLSDFAVKFHHENKFANVMPLPPW
jgi:hypothetical protein